jgi:hypothetical protein
MKGPEIEPIDPELAALLTVERETQPPAEPLARVWSRVTGSLGSVRPNGREPPGTISTGARRFAAGGGIVTLLAFVAGGAAGVGLHALFEKLPAERIVYVERPTPAAIAVVRPDEAVGIAPTASAPATSAPMAAAQPAHSRPFAAHASLPPVSSSTLSAERALLDEARRALAQEEGAQALALAGEHERRFAEPQLGEEREAIAIQALIVEGRYDEARARAARFRSASPNSLFLPAVEASLASIR